MEAAAIQTLERRHVTLQAVHTVPGAHLRQLARISRLPFGTLRYHLNVVVAEKYVDMERDRRFKRFYPSSMESEERRVWDALRHQKTREIVAALVATPASQSDLGRRLGLAESSVHMYVQRLIALGIVTESRSRLELCDVGAVSAVLNRVDPTFLGLLTDGAIGLFDQLEP